MRAWACCCTLAFFWPVFGGFITCRSWGRVRCSLGRGIGRFTSSGWLFLFLGWSFGRAVLWLLPWCSVKCWGNFFEPGALLYLTSFSSYGGGLSTWRLCCRPESLVLFSWLAILAIFARRKMAWRLGFCRPRSCWGPAADGALAICSPIRRYRRNGEPRRICSNFSTWSSATFLWVWRDPRAVWLYLEVVSLSS